MQDETRKPNVSIIDWMGTQFVFAIPVVNLVMAVVWAISSSKKSKRNFAIAWLIWFILLGVIITLAMVFFHQPILDWIANLNASTQTVLPPA